jgi:sulfur carrier protein ThiS
MVDFLWGNRRRSFPSFKSSIKEEMKEFLQEENIDFVSFFREAKANLIQESKPVEPLVQAFEEILEEILNEPIIPMIRGHDDGTKAIENFTTKKIKNKRIDIPANMDFLEEMKIKDVNDSSKLNRLRGFGALKFGQAIENLPDFDIDDYLESFTPDEYGINATLTFTKVPKDDTKEIDPDRFSYGNGNIVFKSPFSEDEIKKQKLDYLIEQTGQEPDFNPSNSKTQLPRIVMDMAVEIPEETVKALSETLVVVVVPVKEKRNENDELVEFIEDGAAIELNHEEFIEMGISSLAERTEEMQEEKIYKLKDKGLVKHTDNKTLAAENTRISVPDKTLNEIEEKFIPLLEEVKELITPYLSNPYSCYTYIGECHFKTKKDVNNSLTRKVEKFLENDGEWKAGKNEEGEDMVISSIEILDKNGKYKQISVSEAQELESEAWTNVETGKVISNAEYMALQSKDKISHKPNYYIITIDGDQRTPSNELSTTHRTIKEYRLKDAPEDAYGEKAREIAVFNLKITSDMERFKDNDSIGELPKTIKRGGGEHKRLKDAYIIKKRYGKIYSKESMQSRIKDKKAQEEEELEISDFIEVKSLYESGSIVEYKGDYIDKEEYDKLKAKDDDVVFVRKATISKKQLSRLGEVEKMDYVAIYDERELDSSNEEDAKVLRGRKLASKREARPPRKGAIIDSPAKFGRRTDKALAVVTGAGERINPLVYYANIQEAFAGAILHIEVLLTNHGEYKLSPMQRRRNDEMSNVIDDLKENITTLTDKFGE